MSRRINFSRRGEVIVGQNPSQSQHMNIAEDLAENSQILFKQKEPMTSKINFYGSKIDRSRDFNPEKDTSKENRNEPNTHSQNKLDSIFSSNYQNNNESSRWACNKKGNDLISPLDDFANLEKSTMMEKNGSLVLKMRNIAQINNAKFAEDTLNLYAPQYKPTSNQHSSLNQSKFDINFQKPKDFNFSRNLAKKDIDYNQTENQKHFDFFQKKEQNNKPNYEFPSNYKFDYKTYDNYRKTSIATGQNIQDFEYTKKNQTCPYPDLNDMNVKQNGDPFSSNIDYEIALQHKFDNTISQNQQLEKLDNTLKDDFETNKKSSEKSFKISDNEEEKMTKEEQNDDQTETGVKQELYECIAGCGRMFAREALKHHEKVCKKIFQSKRNTFNSQVKRLPFAKTGANKMIVESSAKSKTDLKKDDKKTKNWEKKSSQFRNEVKNVKKSKVQKVIPRRNSVLMKKNEEKTLSINEQKKV